MALMTGKRDVGCGGFVPISYLGAAGSAGCPEGYAVCFRARPQRERLSGAAIHANDVRRMIEAALPQVAVLAYNEVVADVTVEAVALVGMNG